MAIRTEGKEVLSEQLAREILAKIRAGEFKPGQKLNEKKLIEEFGTSRTPLREAFRVLQSQGILTHIPQRGVVVSDVLDEDTLVDKIYIHGVLLQEASRLAAVRATDEQIDRIHDVLEEMESVPEDEIETYRVAELDRSFHTAIVEAAGSPTLAEISRMIYDYLEWFDDALRFRKERFPHTLEEHRAILSAIILHEPDRAAETTKIHFAQSVVSNRKKIREYNRREEQ